VNSCNHFGHDDSTINIVTVIIIIIIIVVVVVVVTVVQLTNDRRDSLKQDPNAGNSRAVISSGYCQRFRALPVIGTEHP